MSKKPEKHIAPKSPDTPEEGERIAKRMARVGLCSRREAESWIEAGRVVVNGQTLTSPAHNVFDKDVIVVDGVPLENAEPTRAWLYHKPRGLVTSHSDPEGRPTVFDSLPEDMPRVISVGRLDINTEGLLILTNDGGLARVLELPSTGWTRRYKVRAHGKVTEGEIKSLSKGITVEGVSYGPIDGKIDKVQGDNVWLTLGLKEGKNREVKKVLSAFKLQVNRLIRLSFGPFMLGDLKEGELIEVKSRILKDQLGEKLVKEAGIVFPDPRDERLAKQMANTQKQKTNFKATPLPLDGKKSKPFNMDTPGKARPKGRKPDPSRPFQAKPYDGPGGGKAKRAGGGFGKMARPQDGRLQEERAESGGQNRGKPFGKPQGNKAYQGPASKGGKQFGGGQSEGAKFGAGRPQGKGEGRPSSRPSGDRPQGQRPYDGKPSGLRPSGPRPSGPRTSDQRSGAPRSSGPRNFGPRTSGKPQNRGR